METKVEPAMMMITIIIFLVPAVARFRVSPFIVSMASIFNTKEHVWLFIQNSSCITEAPHLLHQTNSTAQVPQVSVAPCR